MKMNIVNMKDVIEMGGKVYCPYCYHELVDDKCPNENCFVMRAGGSPYMPNSAWVGVKLDG